MRQSIPLRRTETGQRATRQGLPCHGRAHAHTGARRRRTVACMRCAARSRNRFINIKIRSEKGPGIDRNPLVDPRDGEDSVSVVGGEHDDTRENRPPGDQPPGDQPRMSNQQGTEQTNPTMGVAIALKMLHFYKTGISPLMPPSCRFQPTCSSYAVDAYTKYGVSKGTIMTAWRLLRCTPWGDRGYDPAVWPPKGLGFLENF
jgi:putative membrane protein insertion efficiency factor